MQGVRITPDIQMAALSPDGTLVAAVAGGDVILVPMDSGVDMLVPENPHGTATCGAIAMNLDSGEVWAQGGFVNHVRPVELSL